MNLFLCWNVVLIFIAIIFKVLYQYDFMIHFYAPGLKGPPWASSNRIVRLSICLSVRLSVIPSRLQTKCNIYTPPPQTKFGGYIGITLSVCPSVCPE